MQLILISADIEQKHSLFLPMGNMNEAEAIMTGIKGQHQALIDKLDRIDRRMTELAEQHIIINQKMEDLKREQKEQFDAIKLGAWRTEMHHKDLRMERISLSKTEFEAKVRHEMQPNDKADDEYLNDLEQQLSKINNRRKSNLEVLEVLGKY